MPNCFLKCQWKSRSAKYGVLHLWPCLCAVWSHLSFWFLFNSHHLCSFSPRRKISIIFTILFELGSFFTISFWVYDTALISALTKEIICGFSCVQHVGIFCFPIFWHWGRRLNTTDVLSRCIRLFDHAELIETTFVCSGLLVLTKCYCEFSSFQASYSNPCHCLQQTLSKAVLTK